MLLNKKNNFFEKTINKRVEELNSKISLFEKETQQLENSCTFFLSAASQHATLIKDYKNCAVSALEENTKRHQVVENDHNVLTAENAKTLLNVEQRGASGKPTVKELSQRIEAYQNQLDSARARRTEANVRVSRVKEEIAIIAKKKKTYKSSLRLASYQQVAPVQWIDWVDKGSTIEIKGKFIGAKAINEPFRLAVAASSECACSRAVENIDWVWEQLVELHYN